MVRTRLRRLLHPIHRTLETRVHPLRHLFLEVTSRCNLACRHCGSSCGSDARPGELSTEEWLRVIDGIAERFDGRAVSVVLTGGEPLCRPDLDQLLARLEERKLPFGLMTNGHALSAKVLEGLVARGLATLTVSLDGLRPTHDALRGVRGAHLRALRAIRLGARAAAAGRLRALEVVTCVHPANLGELVAMETLLRASGVTTWRLGTIAPRGRARGSRDLHLTPGQLHDLLQFIAESRRRLAGTGFQVELSCEAFLPPALDRAVRDEPYFCRSGVSIASVLFDGAIGGCPNVSRTLVQGNVRQDDLGAVWSQGFGVFRDRRWLAKGTCKRCRDFGRCQGNSLHLYDDERGLPAYCTRDAALGLPCSAASTHPLVAPWRRARA